MMIMVAFIWLGRGMICDEQPDGGITVPTKSLETVQKIFTFHYFTLQNS